MNYIQCDECKYRLVCNGEPLTSGSTVVFTRKYIDCSSIQYIEVLERTN